MRFIHTPMIFSLALGLAFGPDSALSDPPKKKSDSTRAERKEKRDREMICICTQYRETLQGQIDGEKRAASHSGYENKEKLYNLGKLIVVVDDYLEALKAKASAPTCEKRYTLYRQADCGVAAAEKLAGIRGN